MSDSKKKKGNGLIACGIVLLLFSAPHFFMAKQKMEQAKEVTRMNELRAKSDEDNARFKRTLGYVTLIGGSVCLVLGIVKKKKNGDIEAS